MEPHLAKPKKNATAPSPIVKKLETVVTAKGDIWWNCLVPDNKEVHELRPSDCNLHVDLKNGRYLVHHRRLSGSRKSFSWTKRGVVEAAASGLVHMWTWEGAYSGTAHRPPVDMPDSQLSV